MVIIGIDAHTQTHTAGAIDEQGRALGTLQVRAAPRELERLLAWVRASPAFGSSPLRGRKGFGLPLTRRLLAAGQSSGRRPDSPDG
jgi:hypothetical protein